MKHYKQSIIAFFAFVVIGTPWLVDTYPQSTSFIDNIFSHLEKGVSAVFGKESVTIAQLQNKYEKSDRKRKDKVRVLIVPGHEPDYGGTEFKDLKEREIVVDLAAYLRDFLKSNSHYEVMVSRDRQMWHPELQNYFNKNWQAIITFLNQSKAEMFHRVNNGAVTKVYNGVEHNDAPQNVALRLYGINKWVNENKIDIVIHLHFNDYPRRNPSVPGEYSGFSIYVPERQYSNSTTTRAIAEAVFKRLEKYNAPSDLASEYSGVIEDQELIATGSHNTLDAPSMLIEYSYIYEPQLQDEALRQIVLKDLAFHTYLGMQDFFEDESHDSLAYDTWVLPYDWQAGMDKEKSEVFALQTALILEGLYPPQNKNKNDCPRTGVFGPCTIKALFDFQKKYNILGEKDILGEKTKKVLEDLYSVKVK